MDEVLRYRGRTVTSGDVAFIRELCTRHEGLSRRQLSAELCRAWDWRQPNGALRDMVCRGLMLALARAGHIELPPLRRRPPNPFLVRARPSPVTVDESPLVTELSTLGPLEFVPARRGAEKKLCEGLIETYHYLGYTQPVGEQLKYVVHVGHRPVACFAWSSAARHIGPRDRFIDWDADTRRRNLRLLAYNSRFLILPWVHVPHLASHLLGRMTRMLSSEWEKLYDHPVYYAETFVDYERYRGTCYRAANWQVLGITTGRGKNDHTNRPNRSRKQVLGLPLTRNFRRRLSETT